MDQAKLKEILRVYGHQKSLLLMAEETDILRDGARDFLQPVLEVRNAFDHLMRAFEAEGTGDTRAADANLDKALGHVYRSFFDAADWCALNMREWVIASLRPIPAEVIQAVLPEYYQTIRPRMDEINREVAHLRGMKDVTRASTVPCVDDYLTLIDELLSFAETISKSLGAMHDFHNRKQKEAVAQRKQNWLLGVVCAVIGAVLGWLLASVGKQ